MDAWLLLPVAAAGYLIGSFSTGIVLAKVFGWPDPRTHGSRHTGGLNALRGAGWGAGILVFAGDLLKGALAVWVAGLITAHPWAFPLGGIAAVIGHNWPVWYRFQGGMGLATGMGAVGSLYPLAVLVAAGLLGLLRFTVIRHTPRATVAASLCLPVVLYFLQTRAEVFWLGTGISLLVALRHLSDWNRAYE